jgi:hypothetical protein
VQLQAFQSRAELRALLERYERAIGQAAGQASNDLPSEPVGQAAEQASNDPSGKPPRKPNIEPNPLKIIRCEPHIVVRCRKDIFV